jgi:ribonuclease-3
VSKAADALCRRLGYTFNDSTLLTRALTHRSKGTEHNERLEFLGDSVLNLVISADLYDRFPHIDEGGLTRLRASLVRQPTLAAHARQLDLGAYIDLGGGELKSGGYDRDSILADTLEAIIGAIFKDGGLQTTIQVIHSLYGDSLTQLDASDVPKDPKTQLQEYLQKHSLPIPNYTVLEISGEPHSQNFVVECRISGLSSSVRGAGSSRRAAEQQAAERVLGILVQAP